MLERATASEFCWANIAARFAPDQKRFTLPAQWYPYRDGGATGLIHRPVAARSAAVNREHSATACCSSSGAGSRTMPASSTTSKLISASSGSKALGPPTKPDWRLRGKSALCPPIGALHVADCVSGLARTRIFPVPWAVSSRLQRVRSATAGKMRIGLTGL